MTAVTGVSPSPPSCVIFTFWPALIIMLPTGTGVSSPFSIRLKVVLPLLVLVATVTVCVPLYFVSLSGNSDKSITYSCAFAAGFSTLLLTTFNVTCGFPSTIFTVYGVFVFPSTTPAASASCQSLELEVISSLKSCNWATLTASVKS